VAFIAVEESALVDCGVLGVLSGDVAALYFSFRTGIIFPIQSGIPFFPNFMGWIALITKHTITHEIAAKHAKITPNIFEFWKGVLS
jgi:hypothetical protein